jgi:hypothetical protein
MPPGMSFCLLACCTMLQQHARGHACLQRLSSRGARAGRTASGAPASGLVKKVGALTACGEGPALTASAGAQASASSRMMIWRHRARHTTHFQCT